MSTLPLSFAKPDWYTSSFVAIKLGVSIRTVQHWCRTGLLTKMGYVVAMVRDKQDRRYWIHIPERRNAMLRKVTLDTFPINRVGSKS